MEGLRLRNLLPGIHAGKNRAWLVSSTHFISKPTSYDAQVVIIAHAHAALCLEMGNGDRHFLFIFKKFNNHVPLVVPKVSMAAAPA